MRKMRVLWILGLMAGMSWAADKKISVQVTEDQYDALSKLAEKEKTKVADVVRQAVEDYLEKNAPKEEAAKKEEEAGTGQDKGGVVTRAKSKSFEVAMAGAELLERVEASYDYSYQDGYKTKLLEAPKGMQYLLVHVDLETFAWGKVQNLDGDGMVPGCVLRWKYITLQDKKKHTYPCALLGGRSSKPWASTGDRESLLAKRKDGEVRMKRSSADGWSHYGNGRKIDIYFTVPEGSGPFKLKFMDVDLLDVVVE